MGYINTLAQFQGAQYEPADSFNWMNHSLLPKIPLLSVIILFCLFFFPLTSTLRNYVPKWRINLFIEPASFLWGRLWLVVSVCVCASMLSLMHNNAWEMVESQHVCAFLCVCARVFATSPQSWEPCWVDQIRHHVFVTGQQMEKEEKRGREKVEIESLLYDGQRMQTHTHKPLKTTERIWDHCC